MLYIALDSNGRLVNSAQAHSRTLQCPFCSGNVELIQPGNTFRHYVKTACEPTIVDQVAVLLNKNTTVLNIDLPHAEISTSSATFHSKLSPLRHVHLPSKKIVSQPHQLSLYTTQLIPTNPLPAIKTTYKQRTLYIIFSLSPDNQPDMTFAPDLDIYTSSILQIDLDVARITFVEHISLQRILDVMDKSWIRHEPLIIEAQQYYIAQSKLLQEAADKEAAALRELEELGVISIRKPKN